MVNQVVKKTQENSLNPPPVAPYIRRMTRFWKPDRVRRLAELAGDETSVLETPGAFTDCNGIASCRCGDFKREGPASVLVHMLACPRTSTDDLTLDALEFCARMRGGALEAKSTPLADRVGVYAILDVHGNVKIGKSWQSARSRLDNGQTWSATPLTLVGMVSEDPHDERAIHAYLSDHRIRGEWFRLEGRAAELVEMSKVGRGWFDLKRADLERRLGKAA
jgi:hypothetical protein